MNPEEQVRSLIHYFEMCVANPATQPEWRRIHQLGAQTAQEWLRLMQQSSIMQAEIDSLINILDQNRHNGTGWYDLAWQVKDWAESNGFWVPPWPWPGEDK